jgi:plasmid stabilization system protein ParE
MREIFDYLSSKSEFAADELELTLRKAFLHLAEWPHSGRERLELTDLNLFFWPTGKYLIAYSKITDGIEVAAVLHGAQDIPTILSRRNVDEPPARE